MNRSPTTSLHGYSPLYYEMGFQPNTPVDLISTLPTGNTGSTPKEAKARLRHLEDMRTATFDRIQEAENNYSQYYNKKRVKETRIKVGSLVRLRLDKINFKAFKQRGRKLNPLWYGPFKVIGQPSTVSFQIQLPHDSNLCIVVEQSMLIS